jgi:hypothetical protein
MFCTLQALNSVQNTDANSSFNKQYFDIILLFLIFTFTLHFYHAMLTTLFGANRKEKSSRG